MEHTHSQPALQFACESDRAPDGPTTNNAETVAIVARGRFEFIVEREVFCIACGLLIAVVVHGDSLESGIKALRAVCPAPDDLRVH
jgi:hypothetical protein